MPKAFFEKKNSAKTNQKFAMPSKKTNRKRAKTNILQDPARETHAQQKFFINAPADREALSKDSTFEYIDGYVGKEGKFKNVFKSQAFKNFISLFDNLNAYVAPVARLQGGKGAYASKAFKFNGKPLPLGAYWGEISGSVPKDLSYVFGLGNDSIDARLKGNWTRFVNHSQNNYNVVADHKSIKIKGINIPYILYSLVKDVKPGEQYLFDYGDGYQFDHGQRLFLNPNDHEDGPLEIWQKNAETYEKEPASFRLIDASTRDVFGFPSDLFYVPKFLSAVLNAPNKFNKYFTDHPLEIDLPILFMNEKREFLPVEKQPGISALMLAAYFGKKDAVRALIEQGARIEQQHAFNGHTALFYAIQNPNAEGKAETIQYLIQQGAKLTTQDENGLTPVHWCVKNNDFATLALLYENPSVDAILALDRITEKESLCPIMYALQLNNPKVISFLQAQYDKTHPKKFFSLNDSWFCNALTNIFRSSEALDPMMFDQIMSQGLKDNNVVLTKLLAVLSDKGIKITGSPNKTMVDLTVAFPNGERLTYNVKQNNALKKLISETQEKDKTSPSKKRQHKLGFFPAKQDLLNQHSPDPSLHKKRKLQ